MSPSAFLVSLIKEFKNGLRGSLRTILLKLERKTRQVSWKGGGEMEKKLSKLEMEVRESEIGRGVGESMFRICSIEGRERKICLARSQGLLSLRHSVWVFRFDHSTTTYSK